MDDPLTVDSISALIGARLHSEARLFVVPDPMPPRKEARVRRLHRAWLPDEEPILALYDETMFGSGADGFALTSHRLLWRNFLGHPRQLRWDALDPEAVVLVDGAISIAGCRLSTAVLGQVEALVDLLQALGARHSGAKLPCAPAAEIGAAALVKRARWRLGERSAVFYAPALPSRKLRTARRLHAMSEDERALVIIDDTIGGSAAAGVVLTDRRICWRVLLAPPESCRWNELMRQPIPELGLRLVLQPRLLEPLAALIEEVADDLAARSTRVFCWQCHGEVRLEEGSCPGCGLVLVTPAGSRQ